MTRWIFHELRNVNWKSDNFEVAEMAKIDKTRASSFPVNHYFFNYEIAEGARHTNFEHLMSSKYFVASKNL